MSCAPGKSCCASCKSGPASLNGIKAWRAQGYVANGEDTITSKIGSGLAIAGMVGGAFHGYKRTGSAGWAILYSALGFFFPLITGAVMVAQGFGKKA